MKKIHSPLTARFAFSSPSGQLKLTNIKECQNVDR